LHNGDSMKLNKKSTSMIVIGMVVTIIIADIIIDALTPVHATAFTYRLIVNICIVIITGIWFKMNKAPKSPEVRR
jgi:flagellar biosynthesis protein FliQ